MEGPGPAPVAGGQQGLPQDDAPPHEAGPPAPGAAQAATASPPHVDAALPTAATAAASPRPGAAPPPPPPAAAPSATPPPGAPGAPPPAAEPGSAVRRRPGRPRLYSGCQVCGTSVDHLKLFHQRYHICPDCMALDSLQVRGLTQRFCQQCGRFHELHAFAPGMRSCRNQLAKHAERRRRARELAAARGSPMGADQGAGSGQQAEPAAKRGRPDGAVGAQAPLPAWPQREPDMPPALRLNDSGDSSTAELHAMQPAPHEAGPRSRLPAAGEAGGAALPSQAMQQRPQQQQGSAFGTNWPPAPSLGARPLPSPFGDALAAPPTRGPSPALLPSMPAQLTSTPSQQQQPDWLQQLFLQQQPDWLQQLFLQQQAQQAQHTQQQSAASLLQSLLPAPTAAQLPGAAAPQHAPDATAAMVSALLQAVAQQQQAQQQAQQQVQQAQQQAQQAQQQHDLHTLRSLLLPQLPAASPPPDPLAALPAAPHGLLQAAMESLLAGMLGQR